MSMPAAITITAMITIINNIGHSIGTPREMLSTVCVLATGWVYLMEEFCVVLSERVASDGNVTVKLIDSDLDRGLFQIGVTEEYEYPFGGRTGKCYYEKTYSFN